MPGSVLPTMRLKLAMLELVCKRISLLSDSSETSDFNHPIRDLCKPSGLGIAVLYYENEQQPSQTLFYFDQGVKFSVGSCIADQQLELKF